MHYVPTENEVLELLNAPDDSLYGIRDKAMLEVLYGSALRSMEIRNVNIQDIDFDNETLRVVNGKGRKDRYVPLSKQSLKAIKKYLDVARPLLAKIPSEKALFITVVGTRVSTHTVFDAVKKYAPNQRICVHSLRHACATHMLKRGANILHIQHLLGHSSAKTSQIYTRLYPRDLVSVYRKFHRR